MSTLKKMCSRNSQYQKKKIRDFWTVFSSRCQTDHDKPEHLFLKINLCNKICLMTKKEHYS